MTGAIKIALGNGGFTLVDEADAGVADGYAWRRDEMGYARAFNRGVGGHIRLHALLMSPPRGFVTDHINGDRLDNRRANLRVCTRGQNVRNQGLRSNNSSGLRGVYWRRDISKWGAFLSIGGRPKNLGCFASKEDAARAYDEAAKKEYGEYARLNLVGAGLGVARREV